MDIVYGVTVRRGQRGRWGYGGANACGCYGDWGVFFGRSGLRGLLGLRFVSCAPGNFWYPFIECVFGLFTGALGICVGNT